jgi:hypothetical protein
MVTLSARRNVDLNIYTDHEIISIQLLTHHLHPIVIYRLNLSGLQWTLPQSHVRRSLHALREITPAQGSQSCAD